MASRTSSQTCEQVSVDHFLTECAFEAFDEGVLVGLSWLDGHAVGLGSGGEGLGRRVGDTLIS